MLQVNSCYLRTSQVNKQTDHDQRAVGHDYTDFGPWPLYEHMTDVLGDHSLPTIENFGTEWRKLQCNIAIDIALTGSSYIHNYPDYTKIPPKTHAIEKQ